MESLRVIGLSMLLLAASAAVYGQQITGSIVGNVSDPSGSAVPDAQITVKNEGTRIEFKTRTDASGTYTVPDVLAGVYTVVAIKDGFNTFQATGARLLSAQTVRQDVALQVGPVQQTVEVAAPPQLVQTDSPTIGGTIQTPELANLPFLTTTMDGLFNLVPGMSQGEIKGNANPTIAGAPYVGSSNFTLNGITTSNPGQGGGGNTTCDDVYRIALEALRNAFKHAEAKAIEAEIVYADGLRVRIRDDGKGIDPAIPVPPSA